MALSDTYNLNTEVATMADVAAFVDAFNTRTSWTPNVQIGAGTVALNSITYAYYIQIGRLIYIMCSIDVTISGSPNGYLSVSLPVNHENLSYQTIQASYAQGATFYQANGVLAGNRVEILKEGSASHSVGTYQLHIQGWYYSA